MRLAKLTGLVVALAGAGVLMAAPSGLAASSSGTTRDTYEYDATGKRDPFRPLSLQKEESDLFAEPLTPLERYEIGQLRLVGTVHQLDPPRAMVEDSAGLGFIVRPGTPVGPNGGVVTEIRPRQVVVEEWQMDVIGERHRTEHVLELPAEQKELAP